MGRLPKWDMEVVPTGGGPLIVRPSGDPGAAGLGQAAMGRSIQELGSAITSQGLQAEQKTKRLQQDTETSQYALEATQGYNKLQAELTTETDPDARQPRWEEFQAAQRGRLGEIADEDVRERAETWLNEQTGLWDAHVRTGTQQLRLKQSYEHLESLDSDATVRRDDSLLVPHLSAMVNAGHMDPRNANDYLRAKRREIRGELGKDTIAGAVFRMDHAEALAALKDPKTFAGLDLDAQQVSEFRDRLHAQLDVQRAAAAQEARGIEQAREKAGVEALASAYRGELDVDAGLAAMERGELRPEDFREALTIAAKGPVTENDPAAYAELLALQDGLARGTVEPQAVRNYAMANARKLKPATVEGAIRTAAESYSPQVQAVREAVARAERQFVTVTDSTLQMLVAMGTGKDALKPAEDARAFQYRLVSCLEDELYEYVRANPQATREEIVKRSRQIEVSLRQKTETEQREMIGAWEQAVFAPPAASPWGEVPLPSADGIPAGLEGLWPQMNQTERTEALELLRLGVSTERIAEQLREERTP
ncbi:MAG TPA: hypothetical protein VM238_22940 [Phycisphaerae bacterium]|nr:hypothetical protein [Phycisphaerae bacterium]